MKADIYDRITGKLIELLETGVMPWRRDWKLGNGGGFGMPHNAISNRAYRGINLLVLLMEQTFHGYTSTGWITPKKAIENKLDFKGQKTTEVIFWKRMTRKDKQTGDESTFMFARSYRVLNLDQCKGDKSKLKGHKALEMPPALEDTDALITAIESGLDIEIKHGGDQAFYQPDNDFIMLPPKDAFKSENGYRATSLHEATHATGHKSRCDRSLRGRFGTEAYAAEELIAELGSCFLQETLGIEMDVENHASYLQNWLKVLKDDKRAIFTAASAAQKAVDYLLDKLDIKKLEVYDNAKQKEAA